MPLDPSINPRDAIVAQQSPSWEAALRAEAARRAVQYDPTMLGDVQRQVSYAQNAGRDPNDFLNNAFKTIGERATNVPGAGVVSGGTAPPLQTATPLATKVPKLPGHIARGPTGSMYAPNGEPIPDTGMFSGVGPSQLASLDPMVNDQLMALLRERQRPNIPAFPQG